MVSTFISLLDIQSWWEIPCIAHFCSLFSSAFNLPDIDIEDLESALLTDGTDESVGLIPELIVHLLKGCDKLRKLRNKITISNYQMFLRRFLRHQCRFYNTENYFDTDIDFQSLPLRNKLLILHSLCHFRLDSSDVQDILSNLEADSLRVEPLGYDSKNSGYWYFYGTRLYREDIIKSKSSSSSSSSTSTVTTTAISSSSPSSSSSVFLLNNNNGKNQHSLHKKKETIWQVICFTEEDWQNLATKFKNSKNSKERALHQILFENFLPKLPQLFREREKLRRKKLLQVRNSARIRNYVEEKQKELGEKETAELAEKQQIEQATSHANKYKSSRIRRRSQSSSTASGISTYASSFRGVEFSSDSTEFLIQREKFCLSTEEEDEEEKEQEREDEDNEIFNNKSSTPNHQSSFFQHTNNQKYVDYKIKNNEKNNDTNEEFSNVEISSTTTKEKFLKTSPISKSIKKVTRTKKTIAKKNTKKRISKKLSSQQRTNLTVKTSNNYDDVDENIDELNKEKYKGENKENYHIIESDSSESYCSSIKSLATSSSSSSPAKKSSISKSIEDMAPTANIKLPGRQTNNSLSSISDNIYIPSSVFSNNSSTPSSSTTTSIQQQGNTTESSMPQTNSNSNNSNSKNKDKMTTTTTTTTNTTISNTTDHPQQKKKKSKSSGISHQRNLPPNIPFPSFTESDEVLQIGMHKVLVSVKNHKDAWPFTDPVDEEFAPEYYTIIRRPMDINKMEEKLDNGEYKKFSDFRNDFKLIVNNCRLYNGQGNEYTVMVNELETEFDKATKKYFEDNSSDDDLCYPDLKTTVFREKNSNNTKNNATVKGTKSSLSSSSSPQSASSVVASTSATTTTKLLKDSVAKVIEDKGNSNSKSKGKGSNKLQNEKSIENNDINSTGSSKNEKQKSKSNNSKGTKRKRKDRDKKKRKKMKLDVTAAESETDEEDNDSDHEEENENDDEDLNNDSHHHHRHHHRKNSGQEQQKQRKKSNKNVKNSDNEGENKDVNISSDNGKEEEEKEEISKGKKQRQKYNNKEQGISSDTVKSRKSSSKSNTLSDKIADVKTSKRNQKNQAQQSTTPPSKSKSSSNSKKVEEEEELEQDKNAVSGSTKSSRNKRQSNKKTKNNSNIEKKHCTSSASSKKDSKDVLSDDDNENNHINNDSDIESIIDNEDLPKEAQKSKKEKQTTSKNTKKLSSSPASTSRYSSTNNVNSSTSSSTSNKKTKQEKENQNTKSKSSNKKNSLSSPSNTEDNNNKSSRTRNSTSTNSKNKKNKSSNKKTDIPQSLKKQQKQQQHDSTDNENDYKNNNDIENNDNDDNSIDSRSSSPLYKVDLHKKYAQSASMDFNDELLYSEPPPSSPPPAESSKNHRHNKKSRHYNSTTAAKTTATTIKNNNRKSNHDDNMLISVSSQSSSRSRSSSRSPSPLSTPSSSQPTKPTDSTTNCEKKDKKRKATTSNKKNEKRKKCETATTDIELPSEPSSSPPITKTSIEPSTSINVDNQKEILSPFLDKYDLIKQRRNRSTTASTVPLTDEKWNQIVKDTKKNPKGIDGKNGTTQAGKNHYLNKTVEKLKAALTDPVFPVKPPATNEVKSEETVLQKPENIVSNEPMSIVDNSSVVKATPSASGTDKKSPSTKTRRNHRQRKESSTATKKSSSSSNKRKTKNQKENKRSKSSNRKKKSSAENLGKNSKQNTTGTAEGINCEDDEETRIKKSLDTVAINVAAQQTLKDINRWLEFPSHLIDDLYAFALKADPNDFRKPNFQIPDGLVNDLSTVVTANINSNGSNINCVSNSAKKDDIISNLISAASVVNAADNENNPILSNPSTDSRHTPTASLLSLASSSATTTVTITASTLSTTTTTTKTTATTTQFLAHPPPPPHVKTQQQKEAKRKSLKEKLQAAVSTGHHKRKDPLRTIDRLQPGKSKGNLLSNIHNNNNNRPDETRPLGGVSAKIKEVKNSLLVKTDETGPKLSLGSVLNTPESFGLGGQLHSFETDSASSSSLRISEVIAGSSSSNSNGTGNVEKLTTIENKDDCGGSSSIDNKNSSENITERVSLNANETSSTVKDGNNSSGNCVTSPSESKQEKSLATPNLSAWFKAFGGPKKAKTLEEEKKKTENLSSALDNGIEQQNQNGDNSDCNNLDPINAEVTTTMTSISTTMSSTLNNFNTLTSPPTSSNSNGIESFSLPAPRARKASTGSTISERSSFSQDPDSPRVGIEDRFSTFAGTYPSPIGASPIMVSPKPDEITKPTSPYPLNGAIKVGFYQDTTTKSSPEKSCSPRELTSPAYPQYSQHVYSSASSPTVGNDVSTASATYGPSCYNTPSSVNGIGDVSNTTTSATSSAVATYPVASPVTLYEQYKQPHSHESDYNSSMSPMSTNPNSPYQQSSQNSPYHQHQNSPYQQSQNSPYHQSQNSPFQSQVATPAPQVSSPIIPPNKSPVAPTTNQHQQQSPQQGSLSPYQQSINSPYNQQSNSSPYTQQQHQHSASSPYHNQSQSQSVQIQQQQVQQQQVNMNFNQTTLEQQQQQPIDSPQQPPSDSPFSSTESPQYQIHDSPQFQQPSDQQSVFDSEMSKDSTTATVPKNLSATNSMVQNPTDWSSEGTTLTELSPMVSPQQQPIRVHPQQQQDNNTNLHQYQGYPQYPMINKNSNPSGVVQHQQQDLNQGNIVSGMKGMVTPQSNESDVLNLDSFTPESQPSTFTSESQSSGFTSESQSSSNKQKCGTESGKSFDSTLNKHQQMFDSFLGSMGGGAGKNALGFSRPPLDISTSKAFEMFNRAATYGLSKEFQQNNLLSGVSGGKNMENIQSQQSVPQQQITKLQNTNNTGGKSMLNSNYNQDQMIHHHHHQQQQPLENTSKLQQSLLGNQTNPYASTNPNDMVAVTPNLPTSRQDQHISDMSRTSTLNMDYKQTYNNPAAAMLDPLRNLSHPVSIMDENNMLSLQNVSSTGGYYDKNIPPAAHVFNKTLTTQQSYHPHHQNTSPYDARDPQNPAVANYISSANNPNNLITQQQQMTDGIEPLVTKPAKRGRKRKNPAATTAVDTTAALNNQTRNSMMPAAMSGQQLPQIQSQTLPTNVTTSVVPNTAVSSQSIHDQQQQQQQGFQLYAGLKSASTSATTDSSVISLKSATATSMVPGSAFNFGPSPTGLGLPPAGIYGDQTAAAAGYLDEFRGAHNPYYPIPTGHRPPEMNNDKTTNPPPPSSAGPTPSTYHQFLTHPSSRTSYPFMNSPQIDPNSPIYQQYLQRQEELRARMMLNQGLLGPGPATGYPQSGYRPPIGMPKHYDMARQTWF